MKVPLVLVFGLLALAAVPTPLRLPKKQDAFFVENDYAYRRFLWLARDGTYRQINRERNASTEVDRGTWEQGTDGTVLLHFTRGGLRFHALLSGPLSIALDDSPNLRVLEAAGAIRCWLSQSSDVIFAVVNVDEIPLAPVVIKADPAAESFRRTDLESLARQLDGFGRSEQHRTFRLSPVKAEHGPLLLVQEDAVFQAGDLARVQGEYHVGRGQPPPFYFARVDAGTFAREAGSWQEMR